MAWARAYSDSHDGNGVAEKASGTESIDGEQTANQLHYSPTRRTNFSARIDAPEFDWRLG